MIGMEQNRVNNNLKSLSELLSAPVQRLIQMRRSQMAMIDMLNESTKCQYGSFEAKYNVFKQMMTNFTQMNEKLQQVIFETFDKDAGNEAKKDKKISNANKKEKDPVNNKLQGDNHGRQKNIRKDGKVIDPTIQSHFHKQDKRNRQQKQNQQQKVQFQASKKKEEPIRKRNNTNRMRTQEQTSLDSDNESNQNQSNFNTNQQKEPTKPNTRNRRNCDTTSQSDNRSTISNSNRVSDFNMVKRTTNITLQEKVQWVENIIDQKRPIPHVYANFCQLLVLPYSVLQKLIDYNQSAQYGVEAKQQRDDFD